MGLFDFLKPVENDIGGAAKGTFGFLSKNLPTISKFVGPQQALNTISALAPKVSNVPVVGPLAGGLKSSVDTINTIAEAPVHAGVGAFHFLQGQSSPVALAQSQQDFKQAKAGVSSAVGLAQAIPRGATQLFQSTVPGFDRTTINPTNPVTKALLGTGPVNSIESEFRMNRQGGDNLANAYTKAGLSAVGDVGSVATIAGAGASAYGKFSELSDATKANINAQAAKVSGLNPENVVSANEVGTLNDYAALKKGDKIEGITATPRPGDLNTLIRNARTTAEHAGIDITSGSTDDIVSRIEQYTSKWDQHAKAAGSIAQGGYVRIGGAETPIEPPKPTDINIPVGDGILKVTAQDMKDLSEASTVEQVKNIIGNALPPGTTNKIAPGIAQTKDPNTIANIFNKYTPEPTPRPTLADIQQADVNGRPNANIQTQIEQAHNAGDNAKVADLVKQLPAEDQPSMRSALGIQDTGPTSLSPETQAAVDRATQPTDVGTVNINPEGKVKQLAGDIRTAYSGEKNAQIESANVLADTLKRLAPKEQDAITWYREAKGNVATLHSWLDRPNLAAYKEDIQNAMDLSPQAKEASAALDQVYSKAGANALDQGTLKKVLSDYSNPRVYQQPDHQPGAVSGILKQTTSSAKQRVFENLPEAIDNGHLPATTNAANLAAIHLNDLARVNATNNLLDGMSKAGLATPIKNSADIPQGWEKLPNQDFAVSKDLAKGLRAITEPDFVRRIDGYRSIAAYQGLVKTVDLSFSFFHHITEASQLLYQTKGGIDLLRQGNKIMHSVDSPEFADMENNFVKYGGITTKVADVQDVMRNLIGSDKSTYSKITNLPVAKQVLGVAEKSSSLLFDHAQRWVKVSDFQGKMQNWITSHPDATPSDFTSAAQGYAKEINAAYGGLNWEAMGVSKTAQSFMRGVLLAPDWVVSNLALGKYALTKGFSDTAGNAARAHLITAFSTGFAATEVLNKSITGHFTNQNPKGHKWEVEIAPNVYVSLFRGGIGDMLKIASNIQDRGIAQGTAQFAQGKLSPIARTVVGLMSGSQFTGQPITNKNDSFGRRTLDEAKYLATSAVPVPFGVSSTAKYISDAVKTKQPVNPLVAATLGVGISRFNKSSNGLSNKQQASISQLAKSGASKQEQDANTQFYLTLKKTAPDRTKADTAITNALAKNDVQGALKAAADYNQKLAGSFKGWNNNYGKYANDTLQKAYSSNKIKLTTSSINARIKSIRNNPLYSATTGGQ